MTVMLGYSTYEDFLDFAAQYSNIGSQILVTVTHHVHDLRSLDGDEVDSGLVGYGLGQQGLAASRRAAQQHTGRCIHACVETTFICWLG